MTIPTSPAPGRSVVAGFIVGMSRSGTTWLSEALHRRPDVSVFGETAFWGRHYVPPEPDGRYGPESVAALRRGVGRARLLSTRAAESAGGAAAVVAACLDRVPTERPTPAELFEWIAAGVAAADGATWVVEKTPHHVNWLERITEAYPDARFVVTTREPYGFMLSYKHQGDRKAEGVRERFHGKYHPLGCALLYRGYLRSVARARRDAAGRVLVVEYDRIAAEPARVLAEVERFLGLAPSEGVEPQRRVNSSHEQRSDVPTLSAADVEWMNRIAGREIDAWGYVRRPGGGVRSLVGSLPSVPRWLWNTSVALRSLSGVSPAAYLRRWLR